MTTAPKFKPQTVSILKHLESGQSITDAQARKLFGIARLGARIWELRRAGYEVIGERIAVKTRHGKANVARYRIEE
jgi:hypothetical protein